EARAQDAPAAPEAPGPRDDPEDAYPDFLLSPVPLTPPPPGPRHLKFHHLHTGEDLEAVYWDGGRYVWDALQAVNGLLRDFRSTEIHPIDVRLLDILFTLQALTGSKEPYRIISAFRSPETNEMLSGRSAATNGATQVAKKSLHMEGKAMDVRLNDVSLTGFRDAALALQGGGVGYYADSAFVHLDIGPVRTWQGT
ncbi:MAG TPA: DUF882 domain-containing protein, partial [Caulobacter sp.]|nr:DUF882 domain-containing protein [Caulobacter sp.]